MKTCIDMHLKGRYFVSQDRDFPIFLVVPYNLIIHNNPCTYLYIYKIYPRNPFYVKIN